MGAYVLYYHRVLPEGRSPDLSLKLFESEMLYLKKRYQVLTLDELLAYIRGELTLKRPGVAITFDDGWFDNYVYAYPVLKKHGLKAAIFVSTGKIRDEAGVRPTMEDCRDGRLGIDNLQRPKSTMEANIESFLGNLQEFLTWEELRVMQKSGTISVQSHGVEHRKAFSGDEVVGFYRPDTGWEEVSAAADIRTGVPLYPIYSALGSKIFYPAPSMNNHMALYAAERGGEGFLKNELAIKEMMDEVMRYKASNPGSSGRWETDDEMKNRIRKELADSRDRIFNETGVKPSHFCWPWGQYNDEGVEIARKAGYHACYTTRAGTVSAETDKFEIPRVSTRGGVLMFIKRGLIYSSPVISRAYLSWTGRR